MRRESGMSMGCPCHGAELTLVNIRMPNRTHLRSSQPSSHPTSRRRLEGLREPVAERRYVVDVTDQVETTAEAPPAGYKNANLVAAKGAKNDEFYTQWADIQHEMNAYLDYDPDVFRDKVLLLPCDDPEWSNFAKFFALHFADYGLKKLISTSYAPDSKPATIPYQPTLFEAAAPQFDETRTRSNGKMFVLDRTDLNDDGVVNALPTGSGHRVRSTG